LARDPGFVAVFERGLGAAFVVEAFAVAFVVVAFLAAGVFLAAAVFAFAAVVVPVTAFFAAPRLLVAAVFFVVVAAFGFPASAFLAGAAAFLVVPADLAAVVGLVAAADLEAGFLVAVVPALGVAFDVPLEAGLEFSFDSPLGALVLGASLTLPEGPLGRKNMPPSAPEVIARLSWYVLALVDSSWYLVSANFLIVDRETPVRASSLCSRIHSLTISFQEGCEADVTLAGALLVLEVVALALVVPLALYVAGLLEVGFFAVAAFLVEDLGFADLLEVVSAAGAASTADSG